MTESDNLTMEETLLDLERQVWDALCQGDGQADAALLAEEFLGVYPDGFAGRAAHVEQVQEGPSVLSYRLEDVRARAMGDDLGMISYRTIYERPGKEEEVMYVSSIWQRRRDGWRNIFSQDTPAA